MGGNFVELPKWRNTLYFIKTSVLTVPPFGAISFSNISLPEIHDSGNRCGAFLRIFKCLNNTCLFVIKTSVLGALFRHLGTSFSKSHRFPKPRNPGTGGWATVTNFSSDSALTRI